MPMMTVLVEVLIIGGVALFVGAFVHVLMIAIFSPEPFRNRRPHIQVPRPAPIQHDALGYVHGARTVPAVERYSHEEQRSALVEALAASAEVRNMVRLASEQTPAAYDGHDLVCVGTHTNSLSSVEGEGEVR